MNRLLKSFSFAIKGISTAFREQPNFRIHTCVAVIVAILGFYLGISDAEWIAIIFVTGFVLAEELVNTSVEYLVNLISPEHHPLAGKIKDIAAAAVLIAAITAVVTGVIIFAKYITFL